MKTSCGGSAVVRRLSSLGRGLGGGGRLISLSLMAGMLAGSALAETYLATGGNITNNYTVNGTNYAVHVFTSGGTFTPTAALTVEYLIVGGGGGGGGNRGGGGGGAGAVNRGTTPSPLAKDVGVTVTVGAKGAKGLGNPDQTAGDGGESAFGSLTAPGGGGGGLYSSGGNAGRQGGCGGGGGGNQNGGATTAVAPQEGYAGGKGFTASAGGGGGGAGGAGGNAPSATVGGAAGIGITSSIRNGVDEVTYAKGGLGAYGTHENQPANTGNGGYGTGPQSNSGADGADGGSGIVIIRYEIGVTLRTPTNNQVFAHNASILASGTVANATSPSVTFWTNTSGDYAQSGDPVTTAPYTNLLGVLNPGSYSIYARLVDNGSTTNYSATNTFVVKAAPTVYVTVPTNDQSYTALEATAGIDVTAVVSNGVGPFSVQFFTNVVGQSGESAGTDSEAPYTLTLGPLGAGTNYLIYAEVTDQGNANEKATSVTNGFDVEGAALGVTLNAPTNGAEFAFDISITATATVYYASGTATVTFHTNFNGGSFGSAGTDDSPAPYALDLGQLAPGTYGIYASVEDAAPNSADSPTTNYFTVLAAPTVALTALATPYEYGVSITATATCANGKSPYTSVVFYTNDVVAGPGTPLAGGTNFTYALGAPPVGSYAIYAVVTDTFNSVGTSLTNSFTVQDTVLPTVTGVTASPTNVSDATVGAQRFAVTVTFDQAMKTSVTPTLLFSPDLVGSADLIFAGGGWPNSTTYTARYDVVDANTTAAGVTIGVTGAQDANGNGQQAYTPLSEFSIDTANPTAGVSVNDSVLDIGDIGAGKFVVTVTFSEAMTNGTAPTLTFTPAVGSTLSGLVGGWSNSITYTGRYDVAGSPTDVNNVTIVVAGAKDVIGNTNVVFTSAGLFSITATPWAGSGNGGTKTEYTDLAGKKWTAHTFTGSDSITFASPGLVEYLIVGGGGGGGGCAFGSGSGGGGGAGGYRTGILTVTAGSSYPIVVGEGGAGGASGANKGTSGSNSVFNSITAAGGGGGGAGGNGLGLNGGSGGGGGWSAQAGGSGNTPATTPSQGNNGGTAMGGTPPYRGGGGGGAGAVGTSGSSGAHGGAGTNSTITGSSLYYAGGGGGGSQADDPGDGGSDVGGDGGDSALSLAPTAGAANRGGGGGGAGGSDLQAGAAGGSGIVVIRYRTPPKGTVILLR